MKDAVIIRMLQEACTALEGVSFPVTTPHLVPSYNALLAAAKANHPTDPFLSALTNLEVLPPVRNENGKFRREDAVGPEEMRVLFGQLRVVLESLQEEETAVPPQPRSVGASVPPALPREPASGE
jgi:hypothetical protein